jgi:arginyl-tRNA synthetase
VLGQDHHGYMSRIKSAVEQIGIFLKGGDRADPPVKLALLIYQLVSIKSAGVNVKMSKRAGNFTSLEDLIKLVGTDVARFFFLNRKPDAHLEIDIDLAMKKSEENPVYYIQYAYVRVGSILAKARDNTELNSFLDIICSGGSSVRDKVFDDILRDDDLVSLDLKAELDILKKILSFSELLGAVLRRNSVHLIANYTIELAKLFHNYYSHVPILSGEKELLRFRLVLLFVLRNFFKQLFDLLGISAPEKM